MPETEARIFLASRRRGLENAFSRQFQTLPGGEAGTLQKISDDTLRAGLSLPARAESDCTAVLVPYIGDVHLTDTSGTSRLLEEGRVHAWSVKEGDAYEIKNPYEDDAVNFFQITFAGFPSLPVQTRPVVMDERPNELLPIYSGENRVLIGKFDGRAEGTYRLQKASSGTFAFVIEGAFEVQNRLLEKGDGLSLGNLGEVEFEALSQNAVLLLIDLGN